MLAVSDISAVSDVSAVSVVTNAIPVSAVISTNIDYL